MTVAQLITLLNDLDQAADVMVLDDTGAIVKMHTVTPGLRCVILAHD